MLTTKLPNFTVLEYCELNNYKIPRFCYHETLSVAGNCRMCLVELPQALKPAASCAININNINNFFLDTWLVRKAREGVLEFLLINHPLDCPICDQGGECDLQDQSLIFGSDIGRFYDYKRSVSDKNCGPLVKTLMTRCIHCTRCVRFATEIAGITNLGITGRGSTMEIGFYVDNLLNSELSGNITDLCPVGALTTKPNAFTTRPWELHQIYSVDPFDNFYTPITFYLRGSQVYRVLPRQRGDFISDQVRFFFDALFFNRCIDFTYTQPSFCLVFNLIIFSFLLSLFYYNLTFKVVQQLTCFFKKPYYQLEKEFLTIPLMFSSNNQLQYLTNFSQFGMLTTKILQFDFRKTFLLDNTLNCYTNLILTSSTNLRFTMPIFFSTVRKQVRLNLLNLFSFINFTTNCFTKFLGFNKFNFFQGRVWLCSSTLNWPSLFLIIDESKNFEHSWLMRFCDIKHFFTQNNLFYFEYGNTYAKIQEGVNFAPNTFKIHTHVEASLPTSRVDIFYTSHKNFQIFGFQIPYPVFWELSQIVVTISSIVKFLPLIWKPKLPVITVCGFSLLPVEKRWAKFFYKSRSLSFDRLFFKQYFKFTMLQVRLVTTLTSLYNFTSSALLQNSHVLLNANAKFKTKKFF